VEGLQFFVSEGVSLSDHGQTRSNPAVPAKSRYRQVHPGRRSFSKPRFPANTQSPSEAMSRDRLHASTLLKEIQAEGKFMRQLRKLVFAALLSSCLLSWNCLHAQVNSVQASSEDTRAIEAIVHSNPSDHVTEDVSFTNIFGTVRYGRAEFVKRHIEIANTIFKGTTPKSSIAKLRYQRRDQRLSSNSPRRCARRSGRSVAFQTTPGPHQRTGRLVDHGISQCRRHA